MPRDRFAKQSLGAPTYRVVKQSRVLLVGAGGIGCELLKNLLLTGFGEIHIVDLDTIDLSNLNRQFLFRHEHIKKSKADIAKDVAQKFNPNVNLTSYHRDIRDSQFNIDWFSSFNLVFNALDNLDARRHVNKMCLAADVPLIESGTTGYNGQVQVIKKGKTACYDCTAKPTPKSFPVCTIRSTPSQSIHCIVWAKSYLLPELFGESEDNVAELDTSQNSDNAEEIEKLKQEAQALQKIRQSMGSDDFAKQVFDKVFKDDIDRLAKIQDIWKDRKPPEPLSYEELETESASAEPTVSQIDQQTWNKVENFAVFKDSLNRLSQRLQEEQAKLSDSNIAKPLITFDKDDDDTLDFVTAAGNLRAIIFGIEAKSKFDTKQMAGNIIPAIATTNAMIAGLCVMQAFKVLRDDYGRTKMAFLDRGNLSAIPFDPPNPDCPVCGMAMSRVQVDPSRATLNDLVEDVLRLTLGYGEDISIMNQQGLVYDSELEDNLGKKLEELSITDSTFLVIKDETDENPRVDLQLVVEAKHLDSDSKPIVLVQKDTETLEIARKPRKESEVMLEEAQPDQEVLSNVDVPIISTTAKRKRDLDEVDSEKGTPVKKTQQEQHLSSKDTVTVDAVVINEQDAEEEGAIVLDD